MTKARPNCSLPSPARRPSRPPDNGALVRRNAELEQLNRDLTHLQSSTHLAVVLLGPDLSIRRFSTQAARLFSLVPNDLGRPLASIRHSLLPPGLDTLVAGVIAQKSECEREVRGKDGHWFSLRIRPCLTPAHKVDGAVLVLVDIDDLKRTEHLITEAQEHADAVIRTVHDPLLILSGNLRVQFANDAFYRNFELSPAQTMNQAVFRIDHGAWNIPKLRELLLDVLPRNSVFNDFEVTHTFKRIGLRTLVLNARMLKESGGKPKKILLGFQDITFRKRTEEALAAARQQLSIHAGKLEGEVAARTAELTAANRRLIAAVVSVGKGRKKFQALFLESQAMQKKLRSLTRQVLTAQEDERREISRELHDQVVQTLVGINVELTALAKAASLGTHALVSKIARTQRLVEKSVNSVHQFARELRPTVLDDLGLIPALHAFMKTMAARKKIKINLTAFAGVEKLESARLTVLYRVAQESLTNVSRHAHASLVNVNIRQLEGAVLMEVHDNGKSFQVERTLSSKTNKRLGLLGMRERVEMVGGTLAITSAPGLGTTVRVEIPFTQGGGSA